MILPPEWILPLSLLSALSISPDTQHSTERCIPKEGKRKEKNKPTSRKNNKKSSFFSLKSKLKVFESKLVIN